ncbi:type IV pilus modification PilV family protein [Glaciibacter flavus]|uniref:type IV pilus modification PilV family protein n=1 Tax=Orlajensenia flava TaxID=2565934 RepID=UPI003B0000AA
MFIDALRRRFRHDGGFTLIEVITAIFVISILATSALYFYLNGLNISHAQERRQLAITVANEAMETARGATLGKTVNDVRVGIQAIYAGRDGAKVRQAFLDNLGVPGVAQTYPQWDASATSTSSPVFKVDPVPEVARSGTTFSVATLVGLCYQPTSGGDCIRLAPPPAIPPVATPVGYTPLTRIIVTVTWTAGSECTAGCRYSVSSLVDSNTDLQWNSVP